MKVNHFICQSLGILMVVGSSAFAEFSGVHVESKDSTTPAIQVGTPDLVHAPTEIKDSFKSQMEMQVGSKTGPLVNSPVNAPVTFNAPPEMIKGIATITAPEGMIKVEGRISEKAVNVENVTVTLLSDKAASAITDGIKALVQPLQDIRNNVSTAGAKAERDAEILASILGGLFLASLVGWYLHHRWHKNDKEQNYMPVVNYTGNVP